MSFHCTSKEYFKLDFILLCVLYFFISAVIKLVFLNFVQALSPKHREVSCPWECLFILTFGTGTFLHIYTGFFNLGTTDILGALNFALEGRCVHYRMYDDILGLDYLMPRS